MYRFFLAVRYLRSRLVNLIAVGGVAAGVGVLIVVTCVMDGFRMRVLDVLRGNLSDVVMTPLGDAAGNIPDYEAVARELRGDPRVEATSPQVSYPVFYLYQGWRRDRMLADGMTPFEMTVVGIDWERERKVSNIENYLEVVADPERPFFHQRVVDYEKEGAIFVSRTFAERFRLRRDPATDFMLRLKHDFLLPHLLLGQDVGITFVQLDMGEEGAAGGGTAQMRVATHQLVISGVYDGKDTSLDAARLYMDMDTLRRVAGIQDEYHVIRVRLHDSEDAAGVKKDLQERYKGMFVVETWQDQRGDYLKAVNNEKVLLAIVLSFIVLLGGFIILATLTLTVVEKTHDIGVLSALGATRGGILSMFLGMGLLVGILGSTLGVGLGYLFTSNVNGIKQFLHDKFGVELFPEGIYLFRDIPTVWDWGTVLWIVGGSILVAFFAAMIPAFRAARMDPVRALRHE